jgi:hypothetical protein
MADSESLKAGSTRSKAKVRASLACVQCRAQHLKCDSSILGCGRCKKKGIVCSYPKSCRGIRDFKRRRMLAESNLTKLIPKSVTIILSGGWSLKSNAIDLYFTHFHRGHPWLLPQDQIMHRIQTEPFLTATISYIGSLFSSSIPSDELRNNAYSYVYTVLPSTTYTIQGLLCLSIAAYGEEKFECFDNLLNMATKIALDLGMQHREFANEESDSIIRESYRRTYWALYIYGALRIIRGKVIDPGLDLFSVITTTELPCEEWEYQSGVSSSTSFLRELPKIGPS